VQLGQLLLIQALAKKERTAEHNQPQGDRTPRLRSRKRGQEVRGAVSEALAELHRISELFARQGPDPVASNALANELSDEIAGRLRRHEDNLKAMCDDKARQVLATCISSLCRRAYR